LVYALAFPRLEEEGCEAAGQSLCSVAWPLGAKERRLGRECRPHNSAGAALGNTFIQIYERKKIGFHKNNFYNSVDLKENESAVRVLLFQQRTLLYVLSADVSVAVCRLGRSGLTPLGFPSSPSKACSWDWAQL